MHFIINAEKAHYLYDVMILNSQNLTDKFVLGIPFLPFFFFEGGGATSGLYTDWLARRHSRSLLADEVQLGKWHEERNVGECFACLTWLSGLFVKTFISRTNAYAGCGRPTLNFIERFWLGWVRLVFKLNLKCTQMNPEMNWITAQLYRNVLQTAQVHWRVPVLFMQIILSIGKVKRGRMLSAVSQFTVTHQELLSRLLLIDKWVTARPWQLPFIQKL